MRFVKIKINIPAESKPVKIRYIEILDSNGESSDPMIFKYQVYIPGNPDEILESFDGKEEALEFIKNLGPQYKFIP